MEGGRGIKGVAGQFDPDIDIFQPERTCRQIQLLARLPIADMRSAISGAIALIVTWYGMGDIAVVIDSVALSGIAGEIRAIGQTSEM